MAQQHILPGGLIIMVDRYAQLSGVVGDPVRTIMQVVESETDPDGINGNWVVCGDHGPGATTTDNGVTFTPPVVVLTPVTQHATKRAFQNRFPKLANGISTKWDALTQFLNSDSYAGSLGVTGADMHDLRMLIATGVNRMSASPFVDLAPTAEAAGLTGLLTQASIPAVFRLSATERDTMLNTPLADAERYTG